MTAGKIRLSFLDVKGLLYSINAYSTTLTCETPGKLKLWLWFHLLGSLNILPQLGSVRFFLYFPKWNNILKDRIIHQTMKSKQQFDCSSIFKMHMSIKTDLWNCLNIGRSVYSIKTIMWRNRCTEVNYEVQEVMHFDFIQVSVTTCT